MSEVNLGCSLLVLEDKLLVLWRLSCRKPKRRRRRWSGRPPIRVSLNTLTLPEQTPLSLYLSVFNWILNFLDEFIEVNSDAIEYHLGKQTRCGCQTPFLECHVTMQPINKCVTFIKAASPRAVTSRQPANLSRRRCLYPYPSVLPFSHFIKNSEDTIKAGREL